MSQSFNQRRHNEDLTLLQQNIIRQQNTINDLNNAILSLYIPSYSMYNASINDYSFNAFLEQRMYNEAVRESMLHNNIKRTPNIKLKINSQKATSSHTLENCAICISTIKKDEDIVILACKHVFHYTCASEMVKYKPECPICRNPVDIKCEKDMDRMDHIDRIDHIDDEEANYQNFLSYLSTR